MRPWLLAIRVKTLPAALVPVAVGTALAAREGSARPWLAVLCGGFALLVQVATNLANDYYDWLRGADTPARRGPLRVTSAGLVTPTAMRRGLAAAMVAASAVGLPLALACGFELVPLGLLCLAAAWAYTGGPYPLAYHGLGDVFVVLFFGLVAVGGTFYAQAGRLDPSAALLGLGVGLLCDNLLVVNNARDIETDRAVGKRTIAVKLGMRFAQAQFAFQALAAFALPFAAGARTALWALAAAPLAAATGVRFRRAREGADFNGALGLAALTLLAYGAALTLGILGV